MTILGWWICLAAILDQKDGASPPLMYSINSLFYLNRSPSSCIIPLSFLILFIILTTKFFAFSSYACALSTSSIQENLIWIWRWCDSKGWLHWLQGRCLLRANSYMETRISPQLLATYTHLELQSEESTGSTPTPEITTSIYISAMSCYQMEESRREERYVYLQLMRTFKRGWICSYFWLG